MTLQLAQTSAAAPASLTWTWQVKVACILLPAFALVAASDAWFDILSIVGKDEEANHVLLVPFVVGWLIWVRRGRLRFAKSQGHYWGLAIVAVGLLAYQVGYDRWIQALWHGGAVVMAIGALIAVAGTGILVEFLPAFAAMFFLMPVPGRARQFISLPLERITATATQSLLEMFGITVDRSGNLLSVHHVAVAVGEACNGMRMVSALGVVLYAFAFGTQLNLFARAFLLTATPVAAVVFNVIRLVPTVWVYGSFSTATADSFHEISGWFMLVFAFVSLLGALRLFKWALA